MLYQLKQLFIPSLLLILLTEVLAMPPQKRQFGLCQGWGAGCSGGTISKLETGEDTRPSKPVTYGPIYIFTSGGKWNPIGKRSALFTNIPYFNNPVSSLPKHQSSKGKFCWMFPMLCKKPRSDNIIHQ